jgi:hypothetical protein
MHQRFGWTVVSHRSDGIHTTGVPACEANGSHHATLPEFHDHGHAIDTGFEPVVAKRLNSPHWLIRLR